MSASSEQTEFIMLRRLGREAYAQNHHSAALAAYRRGHLLAADRHQEGWRIKFLSLEGHVHRMMVEFDKALPVLLEVAATCLDQADPDDAVVALNDLVSITIDTKSVNYTRGLIQQFEEQLAKSRRTNCSHFVFYLRGLLASRQGEVLSAYQYFHRAWEAMCNNRWTPHYSDAVHLVELCDMSFLLKDHTKLEHWVKTVEQAVLIRDLESDSLRAMHSRLLQMRLERLSLADFSSARSLARDAFDLLDSFEGRMLYLHYEIALLRVLLLSGCWSELEQRLLQHPLPHSFCSLLFTLDALIGRAFQALDLAVPDLEIELPQPIHPLSSRKISGLEDILSKARKLLPEIEHMARLEDLRLETSRYSHLVSVRSQVLGLQM